MAEKSKPSLTHALLVLMIIVMMVYFTTRVVFLYFAQYSQIEKVFAILFFVSEVYVMFHAFGYFGGILRLHQRRVIEPKKAEISESPPVAILIPARHEPKDILESTVISCYNLSYTNKTIYILDDSSEQKYKDEAKQIAERFGCEVFSRQSRHGAKAGIIDDCLKQLTQKYVAIFDVDQNPIGNFLEEIVSILEADPKLAFVQSPQYYSNLNESRIALAADMQQAVFYEYVCEAKSSSDAMICCGTNVVLRRDALEDVGGFDETTVTEDFATSFKFHAKGWKTLYYNHVNTFGKGPEDLASYFNQQNRWAHGNVTVLKKVIANLFRSPRLLKPAQWWEYFITGSYYLVGWSYLFLIFCPIIYVFFTLPSFFMHPIVYGLTYLPYLILASVLFGSQMKTRNYSYKHVFKGQLLFFLSLPSYLLGSGSALLGIKKRFKVTLKAGSHRVSYLGLWPQLSIWLINLLAIVWGLNRFVYDLSAAVFVNVLWITYHFILFSSIFYFNNVD
jgi:cellulose synthase (UDP-forming)